MQILSVAAFQTLAYIPEQEYLLGCSGRNGWARTVSVSSASVSHSSKSFEYSRHVIMIKYTISSFMSIKCGTHQTKINLPSQIGYTKKKKTSRFFSTCIVEVIDFLLGQLEPGCLLRCPRSSLTRSGKLPPNDGKTNATALYTRVSRYTEAVDN
ncbi:hypothetical protein VTN77DRAFT_6542 [Rasamsonia byssochlamydoides]|uniref:uncharacterized protein n=1 Tax=Rasamsonia byssochlamydoides TaxID=89139 RepID=UPI003744850C